MNDKIRRILFEIILCVCMFSIANPERAFAQDNDVIKVAYYNIGPYYQVDESGNVLGYDADYLKRISQITGDQFEFVDCGTWMNAVDMLNQGQVDLIGATQWSEERESAYEYCLESYGYSIGEIAVLKENATSYEDYQAIGSMKIGCLYNYVHRAELDAELLKHQLTPEIVTFRTHPEILEALNNGSIDAIASNSHVLNQELHVIDKYSYSPYYFISRKGNKVLTDRLDQAIIQIHMDQPDFDDTLIHKYFQTLNNNQLSKEEREYVKSLGSLTFCFCTNEGYLCRTEEGKYVGINPAIAKRVCEVLDIKYCEVQFDFPELIKNLSKINTGNQSPTALVDQVKEMGIDVWGDFYYDQTWADTLGVGITEPYLDATYYEIKKRGNTASDDTCKVAAVRGLRYTTEVVNSYSDEQIVWCDDFESCIKAVKDGKADKTVINTFSAEFYLSMFQYNDLNATLFDLNNQSCMATVDDPDGLLTSALNKTIQSISSDEMNILIRTETAKTPKQNIWMAFFYMHTVEAMIVLIALGAGLVLLVAMGIIANKNKKKNDILIRAVNAKTEFLAKMSHDMRTPMNGILGLSYIMENQISEPEVLNELHQLRGSGDYLLQLINDVLDINKVESGNLTLCPKVCDEELVFDSIIAIVEPLMKEKNIIFKFEKIDIDWKWMELDAQRVKQIFVNLLSNAVKFTPEGGSIEFVMELISETEDMIRDRFVIRDTGIGMSADFISHAFEPFSQENKVQEGLEGSGLGLSIVKKLVELMGGSITVTSEEGKGTEFILYLNFPLAEKPEEIVEEVIQPKKEDVFKNLHILLCEDHPLNAQIASRLLEKKGAIVTVAENGKIGLETFSKTESGYFQVILMDIRMPELDGLSTTKAIRMLDREDAKVIPIIAITANAYESDVKASLDAGMNAHLAKPIEPKKLYETIESFVS